MENVDQSKRGELRHIWVVLKNGHPWKSMDATMITRAYIKEPRTLGDQVKASYMEGWQLSRTYRPLQFSG